MVKLEELKEIIARSGMTVTALASFAGVDRSTLYNRMKGIGEFTASEIVGLTKALHLEKEVRDDIFLS